VLGYDHKSINVRAYLELGIDHDGLNSEPIERTWPIYTKSIAPKGKDLTASGIDGRLWEVSLPADMFYKFSSHLLYQLKGSFSISTGLVKRFRVFGAS